MTQTAPIETTLLDTMTATATTDVPTSALAQEARLPATQVGAMEGTDTRGQGVVHKVLVEHTRASRVHLISTVLKLPNKYGMIPPGGFLFLKPRLFPKTLLNFIKVPRMSAWLRTHRICV